MDKHKHYQQIRAYADGWKIEFLGVYGTWREINDPSFDVAYEYRIVPDENGWLPWYGGECPLPEDTIVEVKLRNNESITGLAGCRLWGDTGNEGNITAYRVIEREVPQPKKKVKMWQFIYKRNFLPQLTRCFYPTPEEAFTACKGATIIQRADWTEIEVEES